MIDERDVRNLMRHMFLVGCNTFLNGTKEDDEAFLLRDEAIEDFLKGQREDGYTSYNCDLGSQGFCGTGCPDQYNPDLEDEDLELSEEMS